MTPDAEPRELPSAPEPPSHSHILPRIGIHLHTEPPDGFEYWIPTAEELDNDEGGLGFFHETWIITGLTREDAAAIVRAESALVQLLIATSDGPDQFDQLARGIEGSGELPDRLEADHGGPVSADVDIAVLSAVEVGVSGLVHVLAAIGAYPAASCRGHTGADAWARWPVVYFTARKELVRDIRPLVAQSGCGFNLDGERPEFLVIEGPSIRETMLLAGLLLEHPMASHDWTQMSISWPRGESVPSEKRARRHVDRADER